VFLAGSQQVEAPAPRGALVGSGGEYGNGAGDQGEFEIAFPKWAGGRHDELRYAKIPRLIRSVSTGILRVESGRVVDGDGVAE
jgi:hypothetical protein